MTPSVANFSTRFIEIQRKNGVTHVLHFRKHFTGGTLAGLTADASLGYTNRETAEKDSKLMHQLSIPVPCIGSPYWIEVIYLQTL